MAFSSIPGTVGFCFCFFFKLMTPTDNGSTSLIDRISLCWFIWGNLQIPSCIMSGFTYQSCRDQVVIWW